MSGAAPRLAARMRHPLQRVAGWVNLHRWPWPKWRLAGEATLGIGAQPFVFRDVTRREFVWWAHAAHRGTWEEPVIRELASVLEPGDVFFDVGAFVGPYSLLASRLVGEAGRVVAFEPDPRARAALQRNLAANDAGNVTVVSAALGDRAGTVRFIATGDSAGRVGQAGGLEVDMTTLDLFCQEAGVEPTVMKVDIEGGEADALAGSAVARRARAIILEIHEPALRERGADPAELLASLGPHRLLETPESGNYAVLITPRA